MHRLPHRSYFYLPSQHENTHCFHILIRLAIRGGTVHRLNHPGSSSHRSLDHFLIRILLTDNLHIRIDGSRTQPEVGIITRILRLLMHTYALHILQQFFIQSLHMLMMSNVRLRHGHLSATDTGTNITHTIIVADCRMLIIRISIACLSSIPHNGIFIFGIPANQSTAARSGNHLIAVE